MATSCSQLASSLARQTPVYDEVFLKDFISDMPGMPFVGRHKTATWEDGAAIRVFDKIHVGQPDFTQPWNQRRGGECDLTFPTKNYVAFGTTRDQYFMENQNLYSQLFSLDQLRTVPHLGAQMAEIYRNIRRIPMAFTADYLRTRMMTFNDTLYIAGSAYNTLALTIGLNGTTDAEATFINLGSSGNLPTSDLSLTYLGYYAQQLGMQGYDQQSGLPPGMRSIVTHSRSFQRLVGLNPEIRSQVRLSDFKDASPLYMPGKGINAEPFGQFAPTFDEQQLRFQDAGNGYLERVLPYKNASATTGLKPQINPAWFNARYGITYMPHPQATCLFTPKPKKVHEMIPSVNSAMWGQWKFINDTVLKYTNPDGTECTLNNELQWLFYWLCYLELGLKYEQRPLVVPILHLIDGAGAACTVDVPICGSVPQYVVQNPSDTPTVCTV